MLLTIFVILAGIIVVVGSIIKRKGNNRCTATTQGELIDIETEGMDREKITVYTYSYTVMGDYYEIKTYYSVKEAKEVGDKCTIWYNPDDPNEAQCKEFSNVRLIIEIVIGLALIALGIYMGFKIAF